MADESDDDKGCGEDAHHREEDRQEHPSRVPFQFDDGDGLAAGEVLVRTFLIRAELTGE